MVSGQTEREPQADDRKALAVTLAARGMRVDRIAETMGVVPETVSRWRSEPWWRDAYNAELDRLRESLDAAIAPLIPKALGRYERVLDEGEDTHAVIVAKDLLDRQFGRAVQREERQTRADIHVTVSYVHNRQSQVIDSTAFPVVDQTLAPLSAGEASPTDNPECVPVKVTVLRDIDGNERGVVLDDRGSASPLSRWIEADDE